MLYLVKGFPLKSGVFHPELKIFQSVTSCEGSNLIKIQIGDLEGKRYYRALINEGTDQEMGTAWLQDAQAVKKRVRRLLNKLAS